MLYLAMTAGEFHSCRDLPSKIAWMACHFSPYGTGLTKLPRELPAGALLILNDRTPIHGHNADLILDTLEAVMAEQNCGGLLLDLQQEGIPETEVLVQKLSALPCPIAVSVPYAPDHTAIFLPPVPLLIPVGDYLAPWQGRDIWLDAALDACQITVTAAGATTTPLPARDLPALPHYDEELHLHYGLEVSPERAIFTLCRTKQDLSDLLDAAKAHGARNAVGLYQELSDFIP